MEKFVNLKKLFFLSIMVSLLGCTSVTIPNYIQDRNPYKQKFYASFDQVSQVTSDVLEDRGWKITKKINPVVFERNEGGADVDQQILLMTDIRQLGMFLGTRYARLNVFVRSTEENVVEVEIRYLTVNSTFIKKFHNYKHNKSVEWLFAAIEENLNE